MQIESRPLYFILAGVVQYEDESQAAAIQSVAGEEFGTINEKTEQNWQLFELQEMASPEDQLADKYQLIGVVGEGAISLTVTFAEEGWKGLLGIAESGGAEAVEAVEAAEAAGEVTEAIDILVVLVLV